MNRFYINPVLDMETLTWTHDGEFWSDTYVSFKGDPTAQAAEQSQANFDNQLMSMMSAQYGKQSAITSYLTNQMTPQITAGGVGFNPAALSAMRTGATDSVSNQFQGALKAANAGENQSGLPSGVNAQINAGLLSQEAQSQSGAQQQISLANEQQRQQNYWNSINVLNGQAATENPLGYANAATAGTDSVANASQAVTAANQSQLLGALGGIVGGVGGALVGKLPNFCWVAAKIFGGWYDLRTIMVRNYLQKRGGLLVKLYAKYGEWISKQPVLVWALRPVFNLALKKATA